MKQMENKIKRLITFVLLFILAVSITPGKSMAASANIPKLKSTTMRIGKGQSQKIRIVNIKSKQIKNITYSSSKKSIAKVSKGGNVTGIKYGNTTITCKVILKNKRRYTLKAKVIVKKTSNFHVHTMQYHKKMAPTCTQNGTKEYWHCVECGKNFSDKKGIAEISNTTISAKGHTLSKWITDSEATTVSEGSRHISCTVCKKIVKTEVIPKLQKQRLSTKTYTISNVNFRMVLVEAGTFTMGSNSKNVAYSESPTHKVTLTKDYLMGETEVTEALWSAVMGSGNSRNMMPKTSVTWKQAHTFVNKINQIAHKQNLIEENQNFILPTEAQWEYAAKGGRLSKGYKYSGSNNINDVAQTLENTGSNSPVAVKGKKPNELGLYDMSGNAYEWVDDYAGSYSAKDQVDPQNTTPSSTYVKRGGSNYHRFSSEPYLFTTTGRYFYGSTDWTIGFRIALAEE